MNVKEFIDGGYLCLVNIEILHPLGLALSVIEDEYGNSSFGEIMDHRDDPEGIIYDEIDADIMFKLYNVKREQDRRREARIGALGYWIQPVKLSGMKMEIERKFIVSGEPTFEKVRVVRREELVQYYVTEENGEAARYRRSVNREDCVVRHFRTVKHPVGHGSFLEDEREISAENFYLSIQPTSPKVEKMRLTFIYEDVEFTLDTLNDGRMFLEVELGDINAPVRLPPWDLTEVTGDNAYSNAALAR